MSVLIYSNLKLHSRYESKKSMSTAPSKSSLLLSPNTDSYQFSYGLQGSGKFTDNAFKDSLRSGLPSPHVLQRASRSKEPRSSSAANECLSARSLKVSLLERNLKSSSRTETGATSVQQREPRSKENKSLKPTSSLSMLLKKKPKFEGQQTRVLKDSNRELSLYRRGNTPQSSALCTEQDSFVSPQVRSPMVDINQQLRNIFQVGSTQQTNNKNEDYGYPVAEEKKDLDAFKTRVLNTTYVKKPNFVQSMKKF